MRISDFLTQSRIVVDFSADDVTAATRALAGALARADAVDSEEEVARLLLERERTHTTVMEHGVALPHATVPGIDDPVLGVAVATEPVHFGSEEDGPVDVFFTLLSPPGREGDHIKLLARICRLVRHPGFIDELRSAGTVERADEVIRSVDAQHV